MNPKTLPALFAFGGIALILGGCASEPQSYLISAPPPQAPTAAPAPAQIVVTQLPQQATVSQPQQQIVTTSGVPAGTNSYIVMQAPPAPPPPEAVPARPTSQHVWLAGHWTWRNNRYEWMAGHWAMPPHNAATWVNPRWAPEGGSYRFHEGYWN